MSGVYLVLRACTAPAEKSLLLIGRHVGSSRRHLSESAHVSSFSAFDVKQRR